MHTASFTLSAQKSVQSFFWLRNFFLFLLLFGAASISFAQQGQEPQSLENTDFQSQMAPKLRQEGVQVDDENLPSSFWMKRFEQKLDKRKNKVAQPNKPLPAVMLVLGSILFLLWISLLIATILAILSPGIFLLLLLLTIVLSPLAILGIIFIIGGIVGLSA